MKHPQQYNTPGVVAWLLVIALIGVALILTVDLIKDRTRQRRQLRAERARMLEYSRRDVEATNQLFNTVQEARNDFS